MKPTCYLLSALDLLSVRCQLSQKSWMGEREINTFEEGRSDFLAVLHDREEHVSVGQHEGKGLTCSDLASEL